MSRSLDEEGREKSRKKRIETKPAKKKEEKRKTTTIFQKQNNFFPHYNEFIPKEINFTKIL